MTKVTKVAKVAKVAKDYDAGHALQSLAIFANHRAKSPFSPKMTKMTKVTKVAKVAKVTKDYDAGPSSQPLAIFAMLKPFCSLFLDPPRR